jgi:hypothetical protein
MARSEALLPRGTPTAGITPVAAAVSGERAATERIDERGGRGSLARRYRVGVILRKNEMRKVSGGRFIVNLPHQLNPANLLQNLKAKPGKFGGRIKDKITLQSCKKFPALCHSRPQLVRIERHLSLKQL